MITTTKVRLYQKYDGDVDGFARTGSAAQKAEMPTREWRLMEELITNLRLENDGLLTESFRPKLHGQLAAECDNAETIALLKHLALPPATPGPSRLAWWLVAGLLLGVLLVVAYVLTKR